MGISIEDVDWQSVRGMRRLHWGVHHVGRRSLQIQLYAAADGRVVARLWGRSQDVDDECFEVRGLSERRLNAIDWSEMSSWPPVIRRRWKEWFEVEAGYAVP